MKRVKELLDCPFCGGKAELDDCRTIFRVCCTKCNGMMLGEGAPEPESEEHARLINWDYFKDTAIKAWNNRG